MKILEVTTARLVKHFLEVNVIMNSADPVYIRPLDKEVNDVFDATKNKHHQHGKSCRWVLYNDSNELIGRIAAFTNSMYICKGTEFKVGCFGYFDCINNQDAAKILLNKAQEWLKQEGMEAMDGPVNFGDRDKNWGLMVEGFGKEPIYGMAYNPPYYQGLLENYGLQNYYNQYYFLIEKDGYFPDRLKERYEKFKAKPDYVAKHINKGELDKHAADFVAVYNAAWAQHEEGKEITKEQVLKQFKAMKPIMDERVIWFTYYKDEPIAMFISLPDVNQYFKHFNGKLGWWQKLQLVCMKKRGTCRKLVGIAFGVIPKFQTLGVDSYMIQECANFVIGKNWYSEYEMGWTGDWNPKMINIYRSLGANQSRALITYRIIFDNKYPFERHPVLDYKIN